MPVLLLEDVEQHASDIPLNALADSKDFVKDLSETMFQHEHLISSPDIIYIYNTSLY